jgi:hypothetical protein
VNGKKATGHHEDSSGGSDDEQKHQSSSSRPFSRSLRWRLLARKVLGNVEEEDHHAGKTMLRLKHLM